MPGHGFKGGFRYLGRPAGGEEAQGPAIGGSRVKRGLGEDAGLPGLEARQEGQPLGKMLTLLGKPLPIMGSWSLTRCWLV